MLTPYAKAQQAVERAEWAADAAQRLIEGRRRGGATKRAARRERDSIRRALDDAQAHARGRRGLVYAGTGRDERIEAIR